MPPISPELALDRFLRDDMARIYSEVKSASSPPRREEAVAALQKAWGPEYERRLSYADAAWDHLTDAARDEINRRGIRLHPGPLRALSRVGACIVGGDGYALTPQGEEWIKARGVEWAADRAEERAEIEDAERRARKRLETL